MKVKLENSAGSIIEMPIYDVMSAYFLHKREGEPLQKLKLAMKVGSSGHYSFKRIAKKHYQESAKLCGLNPALFEQIMSQVRERYLNLNFDDKEMDPLLNHATLEIILEGMKNRFDAVFA